MDSQNQKVQHMLFFPSLHTDGFFAIDCASRLEAEEFVEDFTNRVNKQRKVKNLGEKSSMTFYHGYLPTEAELEDAEEYVQIDFLNALQKLSISEIPGTRGNRAVYVNLADNVVGVGTAVVYNENRATVGFVDTTVAADLDRALITFQG